MIRYPYPLIILLVPTLVFTIGGCGQAPEQKKTSIDSIKTYKDVPGITAEEIAAIEEIKAHRDKFTYGALVSMEMFPLHNGFYDGFAVRYCKFLSDFFGIPFDLGEYEWDTLVEKLDAKAVDFTGELTPTEERMTRYAMSIPIAARQLRIFTPANSEKILTEADVEGRTIAFLEDTTLADAIKIHYRVSFKTVEVGDYAVAAEMLKNGEIDGFIDEAVADPAFISFDFVHSAIFFPMVHSPVSMTTADLELQPIISVMDKYIRAGGGDKLFELYKRGDFEYARHKLLYHTFVGEEKAFLDDLKRRKAAVRIAFEHDNYPVSFYNEKEHESQGIAKDVLDEITKLIDIPFEIVSTKDLTWPKIYEQLKNGEISMAAQLLQSEPRKEFFIWTETPYSRSYYGIMSKSDFPNQANHQVVQYEVGVTKSSAYYDTYRALFPNNKNLIEYETLTDCLDALEKGEVNLLMASEHMLITQTHYREKPGFKINLRLPTPMNSYFGFNKNEKILCSIISKAQQLVATDIIDDQWTNRSFDYSKKQAERQMFIVGIFASVVSLLLAASIFLLIRTIRLERRLEEIASKDALTEIFNRRYFMELAAIQMERTFRTNSQCFVVIYDLDHFKLVNDKYGHLAGDKVLKETAQRVKAAIRPYDLFGRYGGEEFILLMSDVSEDDAVKALERLRLEICKVPVEFEEIQIPVSASFGIAKAIPGTDMNTSTKHADEALYQAKEGGRNRVVFYEQIL